MWGEGKTRSRETSEETIAIFQVIYEESLNPESGSRNGEGKYLEGGIRGT